MLLSFTAAAVELSDASYNTVHIGKWHPGDIMDSWPTHQGFDYAAFPIHQQGQLTAFFEKSMTTRGEYQHRLVDEWLTVSEKITPDEWAEIIETSKHATDKRLQKAQKKLDKAEAKGKPPFDKTRETIAESVADADIQQLLQGSYIDAALQQATADYGSMDAYVRDGPGISDAEVLQLQQQLLGP